MNTPKASEAGVVAPPNSQLQIVYADRIVNIAIGPTVTKLTLALDVSSNVTAPFGVLVIPTPSLLDFFDSVSANVTNNKDLKDRLLQGLRAFEEKLEKLE